jgi:hypothetical protein
MGVPASNEGGAVTPPSEKPHAEGYQRGASVNRQ